MATVDSCDDDNLETLLAKATNPLHKQPDHEAVLEFCAFVDKEYDGPQTSLRLLAHKIQSPIEKESLMALLVLEECVRKCSSRFRTEMGKFRFLNEMIKVVSPKYLGNRAPVKVKQKIVELIYIWSLELRNESKIAEAYQMLKRQGVVIEDPVYVLDNYKPPTPPPPRIGDSLFDDEEKSKELQKLLRSRNAEDLQAANRLIKNIVREADKKMELKAKRSTELETVHNNACVLTDMLELYRPGETSEEERDLMKELFDSCERLRPKLFRLAGELDEKDEGLGEILKANDELTIVINNYKKVMKIPSENGNAVSKEASSSLLDLGSPPHSQGTTVNNQQTSSTSLLDDQLLALGLGDSKPRSSLQAPTTTSSLAELDHIFSNSNSSNVSVTNSVINSNFGSKLFESGDIPSLQPIPSSTTLAAAPAPNVASNTASKGLEQLDELGQSLLKRSLPPLTSSVKFEFPSTPQRVPLSQLMQQQQQKASSAKDDSGDVPCLISTNQPSAISPISSPAHSAAVSLTDVFVPIDSIQPGILSPLTLHEKRSLTIVIHFGRDSPRDDVTVMVVSTMSKNSSPVKNVTFQAAVPKSMKIKLQPPSATDLPPYNPILPPAAITQVMLLAHPLKETVRFKYKVNYSIEGEDFTDVGEMDSLLATR